MKKNYLLLSVFLLCFSLTVHAQNKFANKTVFLYDANWVGVRDFDYAVYMEERLEFNDTTHISKYYKYLGPLIRWETYYDKKRTILHGIYATYDKNGIVDTVGMIDHNVKTGLWTYCHGLDSNKNVQIVKQEYFSTRNYSKPSFNIWEDTLNFKSPYYDGNFPTYIQKSMAYYMQFSKDYIFKMIPGDKDGIHRASVIVSFQVLPSGKICNAIPVKSVEWISDASSLNIIYESEKHWKPAIYKGTPVVGSLIQKITFQVKEE